MKAMILAAGLGTRLQPLTNSIPKALVKIKNHTLLEIVINRLKVFGVEQIIVNVYHFADQIINYIKKNNSFDIQIEISREASLLDTGGGLKNAAWFFENSDPFIIHNVDVLSDLDFHRMLLYFEKNNIQSVLATRSRKTSRYFLSDENNDLCGWESIRTNEKKMVRIPAGKLSRVSFMGIQMVRPELLSLLPAQDKFSIIDFYLAAAEYKTIKIMPCDDYRWLDLGKPEQLGMAESVFPEMFTEKKLYKK